VLVVKILIGHGGVCSLFLLLIFRTVICTTALLYLPPFLPDPQALLLFQANCPLALLFRINGRCAAFCTQTSSHCCSQGLLFGELYNWHHEFGYEAGST
jgi:hypothetical protein